MQKTILSILILSIMSMSFSVKKAEAAELGGIIAAGAISTYIIGFGLATTVVGGTVWGVITTVKKVRESKAEKQALRLAQEDAALYVASNGENSTQLLNVFFAKAREDVAKEIGQDEASKLTDLELSKILLQYEPAA